MDSEVLAKFKQQERKQGSLTTAEVHKQIDRWIRRIQERHKESDRVKEDRLRLNLVENENVLLECRGRIQGHYLIYIPKGTLLAEKIVMDAHNSWGSGTHHDSSKGKLLDT
jgi:hypothetical protein